MISREFKHEAMLRKIAAHLVPSNPCAVWSVDRVFYIGGGYWRAAPVFKDEDTAEMYEPGEEMDRLITGYRLINPSRASDEIATIEKAISILTGAKYVQ